MDLSIEKIEKVRSNLNFPSEIFVAGKYQESVSQKVFDNISPIDGEAGLVFAFAL